MCFLAMSSNSVTYQLSRLIGGNININLITPDKVSDKVRELDNDEIKMLGKMQRLNYYTI